MNVVVRYFLEWTRLFLMVVLGVRRFPSIALPRIFGGRAKRLEIPGINPSMTTLAASKNVGPQLICLKNSNRNLAESGETASAVPIAQQGKGGVYGQNVGPQSAAAQQWRGTAPAATWVMQQLNEHGRVA